jgi:glutathione synthase/RimK-type ligase-like ATP-grasp enzyme
MDIAFVYNQDHPDNPVNTNRRSAPGLIDYLSNYFQVEVIKNQLDFDYLKEVPKMFISRFPHDPELNTYSDLKTIALGLEALGSKPWNSERAASIMNNKFLSHFLFKKAGLTQIPFWSNQMSVGLPAWEGETIKKPNFGYSGREITIYKDVEKAILSLDSSRSFILQPFLGKHSLWRLIVSKHQGIIASYLKEGDQPVLAISNGASRVYKKPSKEIVSIAQTMFSVSGGSAAGCDVLESNGKFYPLELNNNFGIDLDNDQLLKNLRIEFEKILKTDN